jgi:glycosyltransferase involved in cell wall biosynthesis
MQTIDIIVPVYNEEKNLDLITDKINETDYCGLKKRIIYVDDCSTDNSREILKKYTDSLVISHDKNLGKGAAIASALKRTDADIVIIQDADLEYNPQDYQKLLPYIINGEANVVYGSRFKDKSNRKAFLFLSYIANKFLTFLTNRIYGCRLSDMETCYKAFSKDVLKGIDIKSKKFEFEVEITAKIIKNGYSIKEIPITYNGRSYNEGKKISGIDALHAMFALIYYKFFN